jgi:hypothetical protein
MHGRGPRDAASESSAEIRVDADDRRPPILEIFAIASDLASAGAAKPNRAPR